jgi:hypothetical protein
MILQEIVVNVAPRDNHLGEFAEVPNSLASSEMIRLDQGHIVKEPETELQTERDILREPFNNRRLSTA